MPVCNGFRSPLLGVHKGRQWVLVRALPKEQWGRPLAGLQCTLVPRPPGCNVDGP